MSEFKLRNGLSSEEMRKDIQIILKDKFPGIAISVEKEASGPPAGYPINIEIKGSDYNELISIAKDLRQFINNENIPGVEQVKIDVNKSKPGIEVEIDRKKSGSWEFMLDKLDSN